MPIFQSIAGILKAARRSRHVRAAAQHHRARVRRGATAARARHPRRRRVVRRGRRKTATTWKDAEGCSRRGTACRGSMAAGARAGRRVRRRRVPELPHTAAARSPDPPSPTRRRPTNSSHTLRPTLTVKNGTTDRWSGARGCTSSRCPTAALQRGGHGPRPGLGGAASGKTGVPEKAPARRRFSPTPICSRRPATSGARERYRIVTIRVVADRDVQHRSWWGYNRARRALRPAHSRRDRRRADWLDGLGPRQGPALNSNTSYVRYLLPADDSVTASSRWRSKGCARLPGRQDEAVRDAGRPGRLHHQPLSRRHPVSRHCRLPAERGHLPCRSTATTPSKYEPDTDTRSAPWSGPRSHDTYFCKFSVGAWAPKSA